METHYGKLRKVQFSEGQTLEDWCKSKCEEHGCTELDSFNSTWHEQLIYELSDPEKYFFADGEVWEAFEHKEIKDDGDIYFLQPNPDGTITFVYRFYNGGTCLSECIEEDLQKYNKKVGNLK